MKRMKQISYEQYNRFYCSAEKLWCYLSCKCKIHFYIEKSPSLRGRQMRTKYLFFLLHASPTLARLPRECGKSRKKTFIEFSRNEKIIPDFIHTIEWKDLRFRIRGSSASFVKRDYKLFIRIENQNGEKEAFYGDDNLRTLLSKSDDSTLSTSIHDTKSI